MTVPSRLWSNGRATLYRDGRSVYVEIDDRAGPAFSDYEALSAAITAALNEGWRAGKEAAAVAIETADTTNWPGGRQGDVDGCQRIAANIARNAE